MISLEPIPCINIRTLTDMTTRQQVVECARSFLGTPFKHQGRLKGMGIDCAGLIIKVAHELSISSFDFTAYSRDPDSTEMQQYLQFHLIEAPSSQRLAGTIVHMRFVGEPKHVGILTSPTSIIHAYESIGKCVEHTLDSKWSRRIISAFDYPGVV